MRINHRKQSYPALALLLVAVVFAAACSIVALPSSFDSPLYVANSGSNSIAIYAAFTNGNTPPSRTLSGGSTQLSQPRFIALRP